MELNIKLVIDMSAEDGKEMVAIDPNIQEDDERLKGDAIGDTLYSESWVLKTLVKLTQVFVDHQR